MIGSAEPQGLFKVPYGGLSPRSVIPALAGIQQIVVFEIFWIPAFARMTDYFEKALAEPLSVCQYRCLLIQ
jgi:hypothetical protein